MAHNEDMYLSLDSKVSKRWSSALIFKMGAALIGGASVGFLAKSVFNPNLSVSEATSTSLFSKSTISRPSSMITLSSLPGNPKYKELALATMEANNRCEKDGIKPTPRFTAAMAKMTPRDMPRLTPAMAKMKPRDIVARAKAQTGYSPVEDLVGTEPTSGLVWDPAGFTTEISEGRLAYFREAELKHGRVCMVASLGIFVQERYHPLFGGDVDMSAWEALKAVELTYFWPALLALSGFVELVAGFERFEIDENGEKVLKEGLVAGDIGYDPLGLKDTWDEEDQIEAKELSNGRLAMIATLGMLAQEIYLPQYKTLGPGVVDSGYAALLR